MLSEISRLNLPKGVWQKSIKQIIPNAVDVLCSYPDDRSLIVQIFDIKTVLIAKFSLSFVYGCRGILISHSMLVSPEFRGLGIAKKLQPIKEKIAKDLQVSLLLATVKNNNLVEKKVIKDWKCIDSFNNKRTGNQVEIYTKHIGEL